MPPEPREEMISYEPSLVWGASDITDVIIIRTLMAHRLLYYITDRTQLAGDETERRRALLARIAEAADAGVDYVQLREKNLETAALEELAREAVRVIREQRTKPGNPVKTRLLINSRTDVA